MKKRIIAITLCLVMLMTVFPIMASAQTPQSIEIIDFGTKTYGDQPFKINVKADTVSKLTNFTYESSNPNVAAIETDGTVTIKAAGETVITARQAGNSTYALAEASRTLTVNKKDIVLSSLDIDNRKAEFIGVLDEDADKVSLDFDKIKLETVDDDSLNEPEDVLVQQGCVKIRGVVTENAYTDLDYDKTINTEDEAIVEIVITDAFETANKDFQADDYGCYEVRNYLVGTTNAADFLGMSVIAYVKKVDDDYEIISIAADPTRNNILEIDLTQFNDINGQGKFEYFKTADAKTATAVVISGADVVFNNEGGYCVTDIFGDEIADAGATLNGGKITLIDNDTTYGYDVIFVEVAETAVVDEATDDYVAFKEETSITGLVDLVIDKDAEDYVINITKDGKKITAGELNEWDVLSIIVNPDYPDYILAEVVSNSVVGTIKSVAKSNTSDTGIAYTIDNTKYDVAAGAYGIADLAIGAGGTFYIDKYGKIAAFNEDYALAIGQNINYAYVTAAAIDTDVLTGDNTAIVQMVTKEGVVALNIKSTNAKLNGASFSADDAATDTTGELEALLKNKVVKYIKNSSNLITSITTADADEDITATTSAVGAGKEYDAENGKIGTSYVDADALVFFIAADAEDSFLGSVADLEDETAYTVLGLYADKKAEDNNILVVVGGREISDEPEPEIDGGYAYVTAAAIDTDVLTGDNTAIVQMVTKEGVVALNIKSTNAKVNGAAFSADDADTDTTGELEALLKHKVVRYTKNSSNLITSITTIDSDNTIGQASYVFDENDSRFVGSSTFYVDVNSTVFFVDTYDIQDSCMGTLLDLTDGESYDVLGKFTDVDSDGNDIVVIFADMESPEEEPDPDIYIGYAYVTAAAIDTDVLTGDNTAIVQMVTAEGLVALNIKSTNATLNGAAFSADDAATDTTGELEALLKNKVVKYTKNSSDLITSITTADSDEDITAATSAVGANKTYDAENGKIGTSYVDADAIVFFIAGDAEDSFLGSVADLEDEVDYDVKALYADEKAEDNNILVVAVASDISPKTGWAILTAIGETENEDGETIYAVEVMLDGETVAAETTADAISTVEAAMLTEGDIVKVKVGSDGVISALEVVYNFAEGVRSFANPFAGVTATEVTASADYVGGKVTSYKKSSTLADVDGTTIKLSQAKNVYVIDANGRNLEVKKSSASNFKAFEALYDTTLANVIVKIDGVEYIKSLADAQMAADYVYARMYDGKVVDLVIVKGAADMRVTVGVPVAIGVDIAEGALYGKAAADLGTFSVAANSTTFTVTGTATEITDWTEYSIDDAENDGCFIPIVFTGLAGKTFYYTYSGITNYVTNPADDDTFNLLARINGYDPLTLTVDGVVYTIVFDVDFWGPWNYSLNTMSVNDSAISLFAATDSVVVYVTNLTLADEKAGNYNLVNSKLYSTVNAENMVTLTVSAENGTVGGAESGKYLVGSSIAATATPNLGYIFKGWYKNGRCVCVEETYEFVLSADTEITSLFEPVKGLIDYGIDENGICWYLYETGVLEFDGNGKMYDYSSTAIIPWYSARETVTEIVIGDGITHIGDRSFYNCISAEKAIIPESVTSIGTYAFKNCDIMTIYGVPGSYAEAYANEKGIPFVEYVKTEELDEITVDMTENELKWYFDVSADGIAAAANVYAAIYDEDDRMLSASSEALLTEDLTTISIPKDSKAAYAKIFIFKTDVSPAALSKQIDFVK